MLNLDIERSPRLEQDTSRTDADHKLESAIRQAMDAVGYYLPTTPQFENTPDLIARIYLGTTADFQETFGSPNSLSNLILTGAGPNSEKPCIRQEPIIMVNLPLLRDQILASGSDHAPKTGLTIATMQLLNLCSLAQTGGEAGLESVYDPETDEVSEHAAEQLPDRSTTLHLLNWCFHIHGVEIPDTSEILRANDNQNQQTPQ